MLDCCVVEDCCAVEVDAVVEDCAIVEDNCVDKGNVMVVPDVKDCVVPDAKDCCDDVGEDAAVEDFVLDVVEDSRVDKDDDVVKDCNVAVSVVEDPCGDKDDCCVDKDDVVKDCKVVEPPTVVVEAVARGAPVLSRSVVSPVDKDTAVEDVVYVVDDC